MKIYLQSIDYCLWEVVQNSPFVPTKTVDGKTVPKEPKEWSDDNKNNLSLNARAINILYCALDKDEFNRISSCKSAQSIWHTVEVGHEGTNQVR